MNPSEPLSPNDQNSAAETATPQPSASHSRRAFLFKLSLLLNGAVGAALAVPILGYLLGPALKKSPGADSWINLGPLGDFPEGETRLVNFRSPADDAVGRADRGHSLLGAPHRWTRVPGVRH